MARFNDTNVPAAIQPYLEPGEQLRNWAFGIKQPSILLMIPLFALAILPGAIAIALLTKNYVVGLTDRRFIVLRFSGKLNVKEIVEYSLSALPPVQASTGPIFTHIKINDPQKPFVAKFHRKGMPNNRAHSQAIEAALTGRPAAGGGR
jgi:hypothetical protein